MDEDGRLVERLRGGDEDAFRVLVGRYQPSMLRLAETTVGSRAVAQEVTLDTWLAVVRGVDRFEGRSTCKTWLFHILVNRARSAARREQRAGRPDDAIGDERFRADGHWAQPPEPWADRADYLDGRLGERDVARLERHLARCPHCSEYLAQLRVTVDADPS